MGRDIGSPLILPMYYGLQADHQKSMLRPLNTHAIASGNNSAILATAAFETSLNKAQPSPPIILQI